jgi:hypothetical protein
LNQLVAVSRLLGEETQDGNSDIAARDLGSASETGTVSKRSEGKAFARIGPRIESAATAATMASLKMHALVMTV